MQGFSLLAMILVAAESVTALPRPGIKEDLLSNKRYPNEPESTFTASGVFVKEAESRHLEKLTSDQWLFLKEDKSILMTKVCKDHLSQLANQVKRHWKNKYALVLVDAFVETRYDKFKSNSLHYEGRAIDVTLGKKKPDGKIETIYRLGRSKRTVLFAELGELAYSKANFSYVLIKGHHLHLSCRNSL